MKVKNCEECNVEFEYEPPVGYPDKRKYCHACSEKKKASWDNRGEEKVPTERPALPYNAPVKNGKEYHLSPEEVRCRALESAIKSVNVQNITEEEIMKLADKFVEWIYS